MYVIKNKITGDFISSRWELATPDIGSAWQFKTEQEAQTSIEEWSSKRHRVEFEVIEFAISAKIKLIGE